MRKARDYHLTDEELATLEIAIRHDKRPKVRQRCTAIRLLHLGYKAEQVAELQAVSKPTLHGWYTRWRKGGVEALANQPKSGLRFQRTLDILQLWRKHLRKSQRSSDMRLRSGQ